MAKVVVCDLCERNIQTKAATQLDIDIWFCGLPGTRARQTCEAEIKRAAVIAERLEREKR